MTTSIHRLLLPIVSIALAGCAPAVVHDTPGPTIALASSLRNADVLPMTRSDASLRWELMNPTTNVDESTGQPAGVDRRLTMAVAEPDEATWWLQVRVTDLEALELQQALAAVVAAWSSVPCTQAGSTPLALEVLAEPGEDAVWAVEGGTIEPLTTMTLQSGGMAVATVTMDLPTTEDLQRRLGALARTTHGRGQVVSEARSAVDVSPGGPQWEVLFDGTSLDNFRGFKRSSVSDGWKIINGNLTHVESGGDIITKEQYDDFELELEWKIQSNGNSGIFYNVAEDGYDNVWQTGPEMQVLDDERHYDGKNRLTCAGSNYALHAAPEGVVKPAGEWNAVRIVLCGDDVEHWLNGVNVVSYRLQSPEWNALVAGSKFKDMPDYGTRSSGHIALQDHGDVVQYRNIRIRRFD
jgi:hypothetical protein